VITFDAEKFMSALDAYIEPFTMESVHSSVEQKREAQAQLQEQLKVLEDAIKTTDRLLLAQVEIAGLVKSANEFITQKETMPVAALGCVVRALSVLADLGEEAESSDEGQTRAPAPSKGRIVMTIGHASSLGEVEDKTLTIVRELGFNNYLGLDGAGAEKVFFLGPVHGDGTRERGRHATPEAIQEFIKYWENQIQVAKDYIANGCNNKTHEWQERLNGEEAESSDESQTRAPVPSTLSAQETSMPKILRQKDVLALKRLLQCVRFERAMFGQLHPDPGDPLPKTEAEVTDFIKRRTRLYIESWVAPIITALIARGEGLDDPDGENALDHASRL